jgi:hypothetical protein
MTRHAFRAGDRVVVRTREEILSTLDADGTLQGLPFMPEMLEWCGKTVRVERRVEKTCVDVASPIYPMRRFAANDVVVLEGLRCDGRAHDGCKRSCKIFWREDWLRRLDSAESPIPPRGTAPPASLPRLRVKLDATHYFCQSTQLLKATEAFPGRKRPWLLRIALREIRNGDRSIAEILKLATLWGSLKLQQLAYGKRQLRGPNTKTPSMSLGLERGDRVRIKSLAEIVATLSRARSNRGMGICQEMTRCCGGRAEVRDRVDRIIDERTGEMRELRDTVLLQNVRTDAMTLRDSDCLCEDALGDCPRGELMYWREIWLERG